MVTIIFIMTNILKVWLKIGIENKHTIYLYTCQKYTFFDKYIQFPQFSECQ